MRHGTQNTAQHKQRILEPEYVDVNQAEIISGLSRWTWRRYAYDGKVASTKVGKRLLIPITEIRRVLAQGYRPALDEDREAV